MKLTHKKKHLISASSTLAIVAAGVLAPVTALAQQSPSVSALDEIVVTAQRREENQQDVPIAVTTATASFLDENDVRTIEDLNGAIPGFVTTNTVGYSGAPLSIRGIGGANGGGNIFNDEPVGVYVDGVYIARLSFSTADLLDVDSIQVLRGPQGTLYGRNSTAGAVLVTTKRPTQEFEGEFKVGATSFGDYNVSGVVSGGLTDTLSGRLAVGYSDKDGFGENAFDGSGIGGSEDFSARASLRYEPTENVVFDLIGEYQDRTANPALIPVTGVGDTNGIGSPFVPRADLDEVLENDGFNLNDENLADSESYALTLSGEIDLGWANLSTISAYRSWDLVGTQDSDSGPLQLFNNNGDIESEQFSQELRLASTGSGPFSWIVGGFYFNETADLLFQIRNFRGLFGLGTEAVFDASQDTEAYAIFGDFTYDISDRLSITLGGRYSSEDKDFTNDQVVTTINGGTLPPFFFGGATLPAGFPFANPPEFVSDASFDDFSPRVVVDYKATDDVLLYASYSQGFKSGGFNSFGLTPAFDSEDVDAFEAGFKSDFANGRARLNASAFVYDYSNLQIRLPVPTGGVDIQNVGAADIFGFEVEGSLLLTDDLTVSANISVLDTEITEGQIPAISSTTGPFPIGAPLPLAPVDVAGNELTRAPSFQAYINANYEKEIGSYLGQIGATLKTQSGVFFLETNQDTSTFSNDAWTEVDLRASISDPDDVWELAVFGQNIFNDRHISAVTALGGFPNASINEPVKWGVEAVIRY